MISLDYVNDYYVLTVERGDEVTPRELMRYGWNFSAPSSTNARGVMFIREPERAVWFYRFGTEAARRELEWMVAEIASQLDQCDWCGFTLVRHGCHGYSCAYHDFHFSKVRDYVPRRRLRKYNPAVYGGAYDPRPFNDALDTVG